MKRQNILVIFGGCSPEYSVSLASAYSVIQNLDQDKYLPVPVGISREGNWYYYSGDIEKIAGDTWNNVPDCVPAALSPSRSEKSLMIRKADGVELIPVDVALPVLHGRNGEDGTVQGLIALAGIPLAGCGVLASALCMDKDRAHRLVEQAGIRVPKATVLKRPEGAEDEWPDFFVSSVEGFVKSIGFPLYVKPVKAGSSYGVMKVLEPEKLTDAIVQAFMYDDEVIIEENIEGFEVGCAVLGTGELITGEVDEIELSSGFFDFTEKYTLKTSAIHVPARISGETSEQIKDIAKRIYCVLGCSGFARVDMFLTPDGEIVFNEVNTIPGFTEHSRYPGMMKAAGYDFQEVLKRIIETAGETDA